MKIYILSIDDSLDDLELKNLNTMWEINEIHEKILQKEVKTGKNDII